MTREEAKAKLLDRIVAVQGIKATQLACDDELREVTLSEFDVPDLCEELVSEKKLLEVCYKLPGMPYRIKSFYLPIGTEVEVIGAQNA